MLQKTLIGPVSSRLKTMAGYFHEIPEEHQLPFSELTESFDSLEEYMSSILKMSSCFIVSLCVSPVF